MCFLFSVALQNVLPVRVVSSLEKIISFFNRYLDNLTIFCNTPSTSWKRLRLSPEKGDMVIKNCGREVYGSQWLLSFTSSSTYKEQPQVIGENWLFPGGSSKEWKFRSLRGLINKKSTAWFFYGCHVFR